MNSILIIEDHQTTRKGLASLLKNSGYLVDEADNGLEAESMITGNRYDLILIDIFLPQVNGLKLLKKTKEIYPGTEVIIITGHETIDSAVHAMKLGAYDYLLKPLDPQKIIAAVDQAIEKKNFIKNPPHSMDSHAGTPCLLGRSKQMIEIFKFLAKISTMEKPVMIIGEAGTGKKSLAQIIHKNSLRKKSPFIILNCSTIPSNLTEEQAFQYLKAKVIEKSNHHNKNIKYTLFLKNIDMASPSIQSILLFFLDNHSTSSDLKKSFMENVWLISSSKKNLKKLVEKKLFRQDLFFRINALPIHIPPLRERKVDIPLLANHFLNKYAISPSKSVSAEVLALFMRYQWPGNILELKNVIEYTVLMSIQNQIILEDMPTYLKDTESSLFLDIQEKDLSLKDLEKIYILRQLEAYEWNQKKVAGSLGIGRTTLWRKLNQYGIVAPSSKKKLRAKSLQLSALKPEFYH